MRLVQLRTAAGERRVGRVEGDGRTVIALEGVATTYELARTAALSGAARHTNRETRRGQSSRAASRRPSRARRILRQLKEDQVFFHSMGERQHHETCLTRA